MKYTAINELDSFQFHDAEIKDIKLIDNKMLWTVSAINVMTTNSQNDNPKDMCVKDAIITFEETCINKLEFGAYTIHDSNNNLIESSEATVAKPEEYENILLESMNSYFFIFERQLLSGTNTMEKLGMNIPNGKRNKSFVIRLLSRDKRTPESLVMSRLSGVL